MFQRCLVCTDLTDGLHRLINFVPSLAAGGMKQVIFMHSVPLWQEAGIPREDTKKIDQARQILSIALQQVSPEVEVKVEIPSGRSLDTIPKIATKYNVDVILTGKSIYSLLEEKLFGSTTAGLIKSAKKPILIFRPQLVSVYTEEELDLRCRHLWRSLLIPYNGSNASKYIVQQLKKYVQNGSHNALEECVLCWVIDDSNLRQIPKDYQVKQAQTELKAIKSELEELGLRILVEVRLGNPFTEILNVTMMSSVSAIAISSDNLGSLLEWSVPSFAGEVLRRMWHPVLFFPQHT